MINIAGQFKTQPNIKLLGRLGFTNLFDPGKGIEAPESGKQFDDQGNIFTRDGRYIAQLQGGINQKSLNKLAANKQVQEAAYNAGFDELGGKKAANVFINRVLGGNTAKKLAEQDTGVDEGLTPFEYERIAAQEDAKYNRKIQRVRNAGLAEVERLRGEYNVYSGLTGMFNFSA
jgi:hypothetical protein